MEVLFSEGWTKRFTNKWNNSEVVPQLAAANFNSLIAFGYIGNEHPEVVMDIQNGRIMIAEQYDAARYRALDWDLRAEPEQWMKWRGNGPGIGGLGVAIANQQLQFRAGDYRKMIRQPLLAGPFLKFFAFL
ncbi:MAG TPA: hypothetical protein VFN66_09025 [Burkholderiales bacterium]|nr:hypothetical protein [Burkholderiales bacterium]